MIANNGGFLRDMAIAGHGILATPTFISWQAIARGDRVRILFAYKLPQPNAYALMQFIHTHVIFLSVHVF